MDTPRNRPDLETKREWAHGDSGNSSPCPRTSEPVFTEPHEVPPDCGNCGSGHWYSKGVVERDKGNGKILTRDGKKEL